MSRHLTGPEQEFARSVFGNTLPSFGRIDISDGLGIGGRPWTHRGVWSYTLHLGPEMYKGILWSRELSATLVHELTHVWQGHHEFVPWGFMVNSVLHQGWAAITHGDAYDYKFGKAWNDYNVEQQAHLVEDWFYRGHMQESDPLFWYISHQIRAGKN